MADLEQRVTVSKFKKMIYRDFEELDKVLLVEHCWSGLRRAPVAAVIPYVVYMHMQEIILSSRMALATAKTEGGTV